MGSLEVIFVESSTSWSLYVDFIESDTFSPFLYLSRSGFPIVCCMQMTQRTNSFMLIFASNSLSCLISFFIKFLYNLVLYSLTLICIFRQSSYLRLTVLKLAVPTIYSPLKGTLCGSKNSALLDYFKERCFHFPTK